MARLRYNNVKATLDGTLAIGTTTAIPIEFPFQEGGVDIPSVVSPDILAVSIEDEILHVTSYVSGTLVFDALRGQENSEAAEHGAGSTINHVITKEDVGDGGGGNTSLVVAASDAPLWWVEAADYVCDGVADNVQIQQAIDAIGAFTGVVEGKIIFSPGIFEIAAPLVFDSPIMSITLEGITQPAYETGSILKRVGATGNLMTITNEYLVTLLNMELFDAADVVNSDPLAEIQSAHLYLNRSQIISWQSDPSVELSASGAYLNARDSYIEGAISALGGAITSSHIDIRDSELYGGINFVPGGACTVRLVDTECDYGGIRVDGNVSNTPMPEVYIHGCRVRGGGMAEGIYITDCEYAEVIDTYVGSSGLGSSVRFGNVNSGRIASNRLHQWNSSAGHHGIWLVDCDHILVLDNLLEEIGSAATNTYSGILLDGNTNDCVVRGNHIWFPTSTDRLLYGIRIDDATCDRNTVIENFLVGSTVTAGNEFSDAGTGTVAGLEATVITGWFQDDVAASQTAVALSLGNSRTERPMPADGYIVGISVYSNAARTAGTLTVDATINGTVSGLTATLDGTNTQTKSTRQSNHADKFTAGQRIGVKITTDGTWAPTTADIDVSVLVVFNTANRT